MCCGVQKRTAYTNCEDVQTVTYPLHIEQFVLVWGCLHWSVQHAQTNVSCDIWNTEIFFIGDHKCYWVWRGVSCVFFTHTRTHTHQVPAPNCTALSLAILCCVITAVTNIILFFANFLAYCKMVDVQFEHCWLCNYNGDPHVALFWKSWSADYAFVPCCSCHILCHFFALLASPANLDCPVAVVKCVPSLFLMPFKSPSWSS